MKTLRFLLCAGAVAMVCASCGGGSPSPTPDSLPPDHQYVLMMSFLDSEGNDLVKGIEGTEPEDSIQANFVAPSQYTLTSSLPLLPSRAGVVYDDPDPTPEMILVTPGIIDDVSLDYYALYLDAPVDRGLDLMEQLTYTLTCPHLFGDNEPHEIVTYWRKPTGWNQNWVTERRDAYRTCYRVDVDGKESTDIAHASSEQLSLATIVLDR